jgi:epoxyqueuosine reductase
MHAGMTFMENYRNVRLNPAGYWKAPFHYFGCFELLSGRLQPQDVPQLAYYAYGRDFTM